MATYHNNNDSSLFQEENRQPSMFGESVEIDTFEYIANHATFLYKAIFGNLWLFSGILSKILSGDPATDAVQRTTTVRTPASIIKQARSGMKSSVNNP